jgi:hypothetical protein
VWGFTLHPNLLTKELYMDIHYKIRKSFALEKNLKYKIIENDFLDISKKVNDFDKNLVIVYNRLQKQFEVHDLSQKTHTFAVSFKNLNMNILRVLKKVRNRNTIGLSKEQDRFRNRYTDKKFETEMRKQTDFIEENSYLIRT